MGARWCSSGVRMQFSTVISRRQSSSHPSPSQICPHPSNGPDGALIHISWLPKSFVKGLFEDQGILHNATIGTWVTLSHFTVQKEPLHTIRQNP